MLHTEDRQGGKKGGYSLIIFLLLASLLIVGCDGTTATRNKDMTMEAFSDLRTPALAFNSTTIYQHLDELCAADGWSKGANDYVRRYYSNGNPLLWVDRQGAQQARIDTLLQWLHRVSEQGMTERAFGVPQIEQDVERMRTLTFDDANDLNRVTARLEYRLTQAWLRYTIGQRYGYVNPAAVLNHLDAQQPDSTGRSKGFRQLFDIPMEQPTEQSYAEALRKVRHDSVGEWLRAVQPTDSLYRSLQRLLPTASEEQRRRLLVNMERCRWRQLTPVAREGKRVIVNVPAFHLYAFGPGEALEMRVGCGTTTTKTPLLTSHIEWMEVNPKWVIPKSIIEQDVLRRAGDSAYFARNRYVITDKKTGEEYDPREVSRQMLLSGQYRVAQEGGRGNSLGRIVFRFKNNFSVFLHDTSTRGFFQRDVRSVSHGCVRVEKPFELANFLLDNPDEWLLDRLRISMGMTPQTEQGRQFVAHHPDEEDRQLLRSLNVHRVPLYIVYYTVYPDLQGHLQTYPDIYGYDAAISRQLLPLQQ